MNTIFSSAAILLFAGHWAGDYWVQTDHQAARKPDPGWTGRWACIQHITTYTLTLAAFLLLGVWAGLTLSITGIAVALAVSAVTHYFADRRAPMRNLCVLLGKAGYWDNGGAPFLDQAWHLGWLTICAILVAVL